MARRKLVSPSHAFFRRAVVVLVVLASVSACAAVLGIDGDYREGDATGEVDSATDAAGESAAADSNPGDAPFDAPTVCDAATADCGPDASVPLVTCVPSSCAAAGGACANGKCALACDGGCAAQVFNCPAGSDCTIACSAADSCNAARCVGGRSCTFECSGDTSCGGGISCESERCEFKCTGVLDSCKDGPPLGCDASVCIATCAGKNACNRGVSANATTYCGITCTGLPSCQAGGAVLRCNSPDASIVCGPGRDTCKDGKPSCTGGYCAIQCNDPTSCSVGYCCASAACVVDGSTANSCP